MGAAFIDSRYDIGEVIGRGGSATVYDAFDRDREAKVALKVFHSACIDQLALSRLARETRTAAEIRHPNVCAALDSGVLDVGRPFIAMERLEGETIRQRLVRRGMLDADEAIEVAVQMLSGLDAAHDSGLVHLDIKPENVLLVWASSPRLVKLLDLGLGTGVADTPWTSVEPGRGFGGPWGDPRADLLLVGLVLFEMLTGRAARGVSGPMPAKFPSLRSMIDVSPLLDRVVAHATQSGPGRGYPTAAQFQHDLLETRTAIRHQGLTRRHAA